MSSHFIVYQTTNLITGEFYIGVHEQVEDDLYLGSGVKIKAQIKQYGRKSFSRETLFVFSSKEEAFQKEIELLEVHLDNPRNLNVNPGGEAAWRRLGTKHSDEAKRKISDANKAYHRDALANGSYVSSWEIMSKETQGKIREILKKNQFDSASGARAGTQNKGKPISDAKKLSFLRLH